MPKVCEAQAQRRISDPRDRSSETGENYRRIVQKWPPHLAEVGRSGKPRQRLIFQRSITLKHDDINFFGDS